MKNYASRKTVKKGGVRFRTPSLYKANKAENAKHLDQPPFVKGKIKSIF